ncbi:MAG: OstA-like protein [Bacteroidales bacterium]
MKHLFFIILFCASMSAISQNHEIKIVQAQKMKGDKQIRKLYGAVILQHKNTTMHCDSAFLFAQKNIFKAFSNISIHDKSVTITADSLNYNSNTNFAQLRGDVTLTDKDMTLTTNHLDYNTQERIGHYFNNGTIVNKKDTLSSRIGLYYAQNQDVFFKKNVELINKEYTITTDTLKYNTKSKISYFVGPTYIKNDTDLLYTENGWYDTESQVSQFFENSYIQSGSQYIYGSNLLYDRKKQIGIAKEHVILTDTSQKIEIHGKNGFYDEKNKHMFITDSALLIKEFNDDSLFLHADSIIYSRTHTIEDSTEYFNLNAYYKVRFYSTDIQGVCDSLIYNSLDSVIMLCNTPILWSDKHQLTGTKITLKTSHNKLSQIYINNNSFVVSEDTAKQYNQMKGVELTGYITDNTLHKITVAQQGNTIYYIRDDNELVGINKAISDSITVLTENGKPQQIIFKTKPTGTLYPPANLSAEEKILPGFSWHHHIRPLNKNDIYTWKKISE